MAGLCTRYTCLYTIIIIIIIIIIFIIIIIINIIDLRLSLALRRWIEHNYVETNSMVTKQRYPEVSLYCSSITEERCCVTC